MVYAKKGLRRGFGVLCCFFGGGGVRPKARDSAIAKITLPAGDMSGAYTTLPGAQWQVLSSAGSFSCVLVFWDFSSLVRFEVGFRG